MWCACRTSRVCALEKKLFHLFFVLVYVTFVHSQVDLIVFNFSTFVTISLYVVAALLKLWISLQDVCCTHLST
jgi:hypothetical protein